MMFFVCLFIWGGGGLFWVGFVCVCCRCFIQSYSLLIQHPRAERAGGEASAAAFRYTLFSINPFYYFHYYYYYSSHGGGGDKRQPRCCQQAAAERRRAPPPPCGPRPGDCGGPGAERGRPGRPPLPGGKVRGGPGAHREGTG